MTIKVYVDVECDYCQDVLELQVGEELHPRPEDLATDLPLIAWDKAKQVYGWQARGSAHACAECVEMGA